ncbi:MAG: trigger factor [Ruminococcaceae bacterium]|nr:trigger factor [Oscillospiraceae bacterium]
MSLKASNKIDTNKYELEISIDSAAFCDAIQKVYKKEAKNITVKGFRKGKAPLATIERLYGEGVFFDDALNLLYEGVLLSAVDDANLKLVDVEKTDVVSVSKADGAELKVTVIVEPEVELGEYKGLKAERITPVVTDDEVNAEINRLADRNARIVAVNDRAAAMDDMTVIDFEGFVDGVAFDGGKGEGFSLTLGSGQFIPGFEDQVVGHSVGEEFDVNVTFPTDYQAEELAGKDATFKCKLHEIKAKEMPAIDDEFAKDVSEFDTLEALKEDIKAKTLERKTKTADDEVENKLIEMVVEGMKAEIPDAMIENRSNESVREFDYRLRSQGMDLETYLKYTGTTVEEFKETFRPQSEKQVKIRLALEKLVEVEGITATEEELNAEYEKIASSYGIEVEQVKAAISESDVAHDVTLNKAIDFVKSSAQIKDVAEKTAKKAPAKKTATKKAAPKKAEAEEKTEETAE